MNFLIHWIFLSLAFKASMDLDNKLAQPNPRPEKDESNVPDTLVARALFHQADSELFYLHYDSALVHFVQSAAIYEYWTNHTKDSIVWVRYANALFSIGYCHQMNRDMETGLEYLNRSLKVINKRFGLDHPTAAWIYFRMAKSYITRGDDKTERECIFEGFNICQKISAKDDFLLGQAYLEMAYQYFLLNDREKMEIYYNKTEQIYEHIIASLKEDLRPAAPAAK